MTDITEDLIERGYLKKDIIIEAFKKINREDFVPDDLKGVSAMDMPLPIGYGQTISQPLTVAFMLEKLDARSSDMVLDVGSGSGWTSSLLAHIVGEKGKVIAIERMRELFEFGAKNMEKYSFIKNGRIEVYQGDGYKGFPRHAPYDRILVSAAAESVPPELINQLKKGGIMVIPIKNEIRKIRKNSEKYFSEEIFPGFSFVPLVR